MGVNTSAERRRGETALLVVGAVPAVVGWVLAMINPDTYFEIGLLGEVLGTAAAGILIWRGASVHPDREATAWRIIGSGFFLASIGVLATGVLASVGILPAFGSHDLVFLSAYSLAIVGLLIMPHVGSGVQSRVRIFLDGLIGAVGVAILMYVFFLPGIRIHLDSATPWERFAGVAYPLLDSLLVVVAMIVTIRRSAWRFDIRIAALGSALALQALADLRLLNSGVGESLTDASPDFRFFLGAVILELVVAATIRRRMKPKEYADRRQPVWAMVAPYGAMVVALLVIVREAAKVEIPINIIFLLGMGLTITALVVLRQIFALREYRSLVSQQREGLVASVSHELRTPLTAMVGFLEILDDTSIEIGSAERKDLIAIVRQQSLYMSRIVDDLVLLAREVSALNEVEVDIREWIDESLKASAVTGNVVEVDIAPGLAGFFDRDRTRQALDNLVVNAFRYGKGQVLLRSYSEGNDLVIEVHDNGPGVPRKFELSIWEQFERGANRLNATTPGSGIGLAIVDLVVRRHGGTATYLRSTILGGSCFRVVLPNRVREESTARSHLRPAHLAS